MTLIFQNEVGIMEGTIVSSGKYTQTSLQIQGFSFYSACRKARNTEWLATEGKNLV